MNVLRGVGWQQLAGGSKLRQALLLAGCLGLLLIGAYFAHLQALVAQIDSGAEQLQQLRMEQANKNARARALESNHAQWVSAHKRLDESRWRLAAGGELTGLIEEISSQAQSHGVFVEQLELLPEVIHEHHVEMPLQLRLHGAYAALAGFAHGLAQLPRLTSLNNIALKPSEHRGFTGLQLQAQISAFRSRESPGGVFPSALEPPSMRPLPRLSRSPFEPAALMLHRQYLETLPLDQFEMIGSLARRQVHFALLRVAGVVHRLQVGDRLGRDNGRIVHVEEQRIEIAEEVFVVGKGWVERRRTLSLKSPATTG
ncbi:MAG: pilus assembly protein PilP [Pseudomonas sp.]